MSQASRPVARLPVSVATLALCCATAAPFGANASLLGDTVTVFLESHFFGGFNNFPNDTAVVGPGVEFETVDHAVDPTYDWLYTSRIIMDFGADSILYKHTIEVPGTAGIGGQSWGTAYTAWVSNLNWNGTNVPLSFDIIHEDRVQLVSAGAQTAQILAPATHFWFGIWGPSYYEHSLLLRVSPVPEPSGAWLAALGVMGLLLRRRLPVTA